MSTPVIFWYRQDLRVTDLPGLAAAAATGRPVLPCFILDDETPGEWRSGAASRWWLHHSLDALAADLATRDAPLVLRRGRTRDVLAQLVRETGATDVFCSRMHEPWAARLESELHDDFEAAGIAFKRYGGALLHEPETVHNQGGEPYKVYTPFWRFCRRLPEPAPPKALPRKVQWSSATVESETLAAWRLCPEKPDWAAAWTKLWEPGAAGARKRMRAFLRRDVADYSEGRDFPSLDCTSRLSPHLHHGEISPREVWHDARRAAANDPALEEQVDKFLSELGWREFSYHLLHHFPHIPEQPFKPSFSEFPWLADRARLRAWQTGQTGYPMVDAGMRELWQTGYMHNRVRMVVASFLTKHLLLHWREGAAWFWDTLLDADLANNSCGWQWVAGSGADAAPYFRIFNPTAQGKKFDGAGDYIRRWVPELSALPDRYLHEPSSAPEPVLEAAGVRLGDTYPLPVVNHASARESALAAYDSTRKD